MYNLICTCDHRQAPDGIDIVVARCQPEHVFRSRAVETPVADGNSDPAGSLAAKLQQFVTLRKHTQ